MLRDDTLEALSDACALSDKLYDQGGMSFNYHYGHNLAHTLKHSPNLASTFCDESLGKMKVFFEFSICGPEAQKGSHETIGFVSKLVSLFYRDFKGFQCAVSRYEDGGVWRDLDLLFTNNRSYHTLKFMASLD